MKDSDRIRFEAAQWVVDIHDVEDPSAEMLQRWVQWLEASPEHQLEFDLAEAIWRHAPGVGGSEAKLNEDDGYDGNTSVADWRRLRAAKAAQASRSTRVRFASLCTHAAFLSAAAAACVLAFVVVAGRDSGVRAPRDTFFTRTGESMNIVLEDGSRVALGARSRIAVNFTGGTRNVRLEAGEAYFSVHKDRNRPFRVSVQNRVVTAVGTAFDVRRTSTGVVVAVSEGVVSVSTATDVAPVVVPPPVLGTLGTDVPSSVTHLARGQQLSISSETNAPGPVTVTAVDPTQAARWRDGWLVYRDEPLRDVIEDVERYSDRRIEIASSVPAALRFTGAVFKDSAIEWLKSLPEVFPLAVNESAQTITIMGAPTSVITRLQ
jgi:transmembrane sensor